MPRKIIAPEGTQWCCRCKQPRPIEEFSPGDKRCRPCVREYRHEKYGTKALVIPPEGQQRCSHCKTCKDKSEFSASQLKLPPGASIRRTGYCRECYSNRTYREPRANKRVCKYGLDHHSTKRILDHPISSDPLKLAYVAGVFDAEGSAQIMPSVIGNPVMSFASNNSLLLDSVYEIIGGRVNYYERSSEKGGFVSEGRLDVSSLIEVSEVCKALIPYLVLKKRRCEILLEACALSPSERVKLRPSLVELNAKCTREELVGFDRKTIDLIDVNAVSDVDFSYLAGMIDGDGWIGFNRRLPTISIASTKTVQVEYFYKKFGGFVSHPKSNPNQATVVCWSMRSDVSGWKEILKRLSKYLVLKKRHAELALQCIGRDSNEQCHICVEMSNLTQYNRQEKFRRVDSGSNSSVLKKKERHQ